MIGRSTVRNEKYLKTPQKDNTICDLRLERYNTLRKIKRLQCKAMTMTEDGCTDSSIKEDVQKNCSKKIFSSKKN